MASPATSLAKFDTFLLDAGKIWKTYKETKEKLEPFSKADEALEKAGAASKGELPAYNESLEKLRVYVANQKAKLAELAAKDENYWVGRSGADLNSVMAMTKAKALFDQWAAGFSQLRTLIQQLLPAVQSAKTVFGNNAVGAIRSGFAFDSTPPLDGIALSEIVANLNNSLSNLDRILLRLRNVRTSWLR